jgi:hypothetical protein
MMRRSIFNRVHLEKDSGVICLEMIKKIQDARFRIVEVPVHHYHRAYGKSQFFNFPRIYRTGLDVWKLWFALVVRGTHRSALEVMEVPEESRSGARHWGHARDESTGAGQGAGAPATRK